MNELSTNLSGWFAIGFSQELQRNQTKTGFLCNEKYSLHRDKNSRLFFNATDKNICEQNSIIYVWRHPSNPPCWHIPVLDEKNWSSFLHHQLLIRSHPQEIYENSIDIAHFGVVHKFKKLIVDQNPIFTQHNMLVKHNIQRKHPNPFKQKNIHASFEVFLHGIGCAHTHIQIPDLDMQVRMFSLATPSFGNLVEIRICVAIHIMNNNLLPKICMPIILHSIKKNIVHDFCQDLIVWENKCYRRQPLLVKGDGDIIKFRRWCEQFYVTQ